MAEEVHAPKLLPMKLVSVSEPWGMILLDNGTTIRYRLIIRAVQLVNGPLDASGQPNYLIEHSMVLDVRP